MYVRKIKPEEYPRTEELFAIAFELPWQENKAEAEELMERVTKNPANRLEQDFGERWAAFDENDNMMAFFSAPPYPVRFDGGGAVMSAVGAVSTLPQYRKYGAMRGCFAKAMQDMYDEGIQFSYLYPFSQKYYRKFGYELCGQKIRYEIDLRAIPEIKQEGCAVLLERGNVAEDMAAVYCAFAGQYNLSVERSEIDYKWTKDADPSKDGRYVYVCYDKNGKACAVVDFTKEKKNGRVTMSCSRLYFVGDAGLLEALAFIRSVGTYYERVIFMLPEDIELPTYVPEWSLYPSSRELHFMGMARVIRVDKVLEQAAYIGDGTFLLQIEDEMLPGNNRCFRVEFKGGRAIAVEPQQDVAAGQVREQIGAAAFETVPYLKLPIGMFSKWILEGCSHRQFLNIEGVTKENVSLWNRVFPEKPVWLDDAF